MDYYLLSEQDIYEINLEFENLLYEIIEKIKNKKIEEEDKGD
jgi:hypothetical protein